MHTVHCCRDTVALVERRMVSVVLPEGQKLYCREPSPCPHAEARPVWVCFSDFRGHSPGQQLALPVRKPVENAAANTLPRVFCCHRIVCAVGVLQLHVGWQREVHTATAEG